MSEIYDFIACAFIALIPAVPVALLGAPLWVAFLVFVGVFLLFLRHA